MLTHTDLGKDGCLCATFSFGSYGVHPRLQHFRYHVPPSLVPEDLPSSIAKFTAAVEKMTAHQEVQAAMVVQHSPTNRQPPYSSGMPRRRPLATNQCFNCNQLGHYARDCQWDTHCSHCRG